MGSRLTNIRHSAGLGCPADAAGGRGLWWSHPQEEGIVFKEFGPTLPAADMERAKVFYREFRGSPIRTVKFAE